jgi:hypothetical protein
MHERLLLVCSTACMQCAKGLLQLHALVSAMYIYGFVMAISRHGLNRMVKHGVLAKATFEETLEMLFEAAAFGFTDPLLGVSENTMIGWQAKMGTNLSQHVAPRFLATCEHSSRYTPISIDTTLTKQRPIDRFGGRRVPWRYEPHTVPRAWPRARRQASAPSDAQPTPSPDRHRGTCWSLVTCCRWRLHLFEQLHAVPQYPSVQQLG